MWHTRCMSTCKLANQFRRLCAHWHAECECVCIGSQWGCRLFMPVRSLWSVFSGVHDLACENPFTSNTNTHMHTCTHSYGNGVDLDGIPCCVLYCMVVLVVVWWWWWGGWGLSRKVSLTLSAAAYRSMWNECKRLQTPPLMGLINDRWNSCCFSHHRTVCFQWKQGTELEERMTGTTEVGNLTFSLSCHIPTLTNRHTCTLLFANSASKKSPHLSEPTCKMPWHIFFKALHEICIFQINNANSGNAYVLTH